MSWIPHITVAAIIEQNENFLLVKELVQNCEVYNQPAGHLEENESLIEAVKRETLEETGAQFEPQSIIGIYHYQEANSRETYLRVAFGGEILAHDTNATLDCSIIEAIWLNLPAIRALTQVQMRSVMVLQCIEDYLVGTRYPLDLLSYVNCRSR